MVTAEALLKKYWGYDSFRPYQKPLIEQAILGKDSLGVLPTGGGKSVCYQIPALLFEGVTVVISPLIALMEDQIIQLRKRNIRAMAFSSQKKQSLDEQFDNAHHGNYKLLYLAPERLRQEKFLKRLVQLPIQLIAVDEAHCISEWGHDFRPSYRKIALLRSYLPHVPFMAVTATATPKVIDDIKENLALVQPQVFLDSFRRENIAIQLLQTEDKIGFLQQYLKKNSQPTIIYSWTRKEAENTAQLLNNCGFAAAYFHGGLSFEEKQERLNTWQNETVPIMVATSAFGMGVDKANVRSVVHLNLPESLESYYQQIGRAGRDGLPSKALLLLSSQDKSWAKKRTKQQLLAPDFITTAYKALNNYLQIPYGAGQDTTYALNFSAFCKAYNFSASTTWAFFKLLEQEGLCSLQQQFNKELKLRVLLSPEGFRNSHTKVASINSFKEYLSRNYHELFQREITITVKELSKALKQTAKQINKVLATLEKDSTIQLTAATTDLWIHMHQPREDHYTLATIIQNIKVRNTNQKIKLETLLEFAFSEGKCKQQQLLQYFGENISVKCNKCSANCCRPKDTHAQVKHRLIAALKNKSLALHELQALVPESGSVLVTILHQMAAQKRIVYNANQQWEYVE